LQSGDFHTGPNSFSTYRKGGGRVELCDFPRRRRSCSALPTGCRLAEQVLAEGRTGRRRYQRLGLTRTDGFGLRRRQRPRNGDGSIRTEQIAFQRCLVDSAGATSKDKPRLATCGAGTGSRCQYDLPRVGSAIPSPPVLRADRLFTVVQQTDDGGASLRWSGASRR